MTIRTVLVLAIALMPRCPHAGAEGDKKKEGQVVRFPGITILVDRRKVVVEGEVILQHGLIELFATAPRGKEHESILRLDCRPNLLQTGLYLIGLRAGGGPRFQGDTLAPIGSRVVLEVEWKLKGKTHRHRAEDLIWDHKRRTKMPRTSWTFTGSRFMKNPRTGREVFMANVTGVMVVTLSDPDAILNNPLADRSDDTAYYVNSKVVPEPGTKIRLVITPAPAPIKKSRAPVKGSVKEKK